MAYQVVQKVLCFLTAQERHRQTDGQTDVKAIAIAERFLRNPR